MEMGRSGEEGDNYPQSIANSKFWEGVKSLTDPSADGTDIAIGLASAGYYCCKYHSKTRKKQSPNISMNRVRSGQL